MPDHTRRSDIVFAFALVIGLYVAYLLANVLLLIYLSALFAVVLQPGIAVIQKLRLGSWRPGRGVAIITLFVLVFATVTLFLVFALPPIFRDMRRAVTDMPQRVQQLSDWLHRLPMLQDFDVRGLLQYASGAVGGVFGVFTGVAGGVIKLFSFLVLVAYFVVDGERAFHWVASLFPPARRARLEATALRADLRVRNWLIGQLALMLILAVSSLVVFWALDLNYFYALAVFAGVSNIVPILGPIVTVVLASLVAAADHWTKLVGVGIFFFVYQQVENAFLTPRIMRSTVDLPGLAVVIALAIGGSLAGPVGAIVAVPTAAVIAVLIDEYVVKKNAPPTLGFTVSSAVSPPPAPVASPEEPV